ncbi:MAG: hypothetical protein ACYS6K_10435 [Planctomycetota bacterium]|jgi:hypothetical protein
MKVGDRTICVNCVTVGIVRAGEILDVGNILTSPDLLQAVGLPARR